jgi:hypothetical protein
MYGRRPKPRGNCEHDWAKSSRFSGDHHDRPFHEANIAPME